MMSDDSVAVLLRDAHGRFSYLSQEVLDATRVPAELQLALERHVEDNAVVGFGLGLAPSLIATNLAGPMGAGADINSMALLVMMNSTANANADLQGIMNSLHPMGFSFMRPPTH